MPIRKIVAVLIPIIVAAIWGYFFLTITEISVIRFLLVAILMPMVLASFYISILAWSERKKALVVGSLLILLIIGTWTYSFLTTTDLSFTSFLLVAILVPMVFVSFCIPILVWRKRKPKI